MRLPRCHARPTGRKSPGGAVLLGLFGVLVAAGALVAKIVDGATREGDSPRAKLYAQPRAAPHLETYTGAVIEGGLAVWGGERLLGEGVISSVRDPTAADLSRVSRPTGLLVLAGAEEHPYYDAITWRFRVRTDEPGAWNHEMSVECARGVAKIAWSVSLVDGHPPDGDIVFYPSLWGLGVAGEHDVEALFRMLRGCDARVHLVDDLKAVADFSPRLIFVATPFAAQLDSAVVAQLDECVQRGGVVVVSGGVTRDACDRLERFVGRYGIRYVEDALQHERRPARASTLENDGDVGPLFMKSRPSMADGFFHGVEKLEWQGGKYRPQAVEGSRAAEVKCQTAGGVVPVAVVAHQVGYVLAMPTGNYGLFTVGYPYDNDHLFGNILTVSTESAGEDGGSPR